MNLNNTIELVSTHYKTNLLLEALDDNYEKMVFALNGEKVIEAYRDMKTDLLEVDMITIKDYIYNEYKNYLEIDELEELIVKEQNKVKDVIPRTTFVKTLHKSDVINASLINDDYLVVFTQTGLRIFNFDKDLETGKDLIKKSSYFI